jgi:Asp-tRNA(Asn)/Glu-tRNA(Gln) amidotransferase A subunit family amidase
MADFTPPDADAVAALADRLALPLAGGEFESAAHRAGALADVYERLGRVPEAIVTPSTHVEDAYAVDPHPPDDDPNNAWLSRFELSRPAADGPLAGHDVAIKDNTCVAGAPLTNGSRAFEGFSPDGHAAVVDRLLDAGATLVGKTNMDELAFGPTSETSAFGPVENPRAPGHVAGGSSSGSAAAVAAGTVDLALGTDTGGSVRIPASYCGVVGLKPTYGRVPLHGVTPLAASLDHVGPIAPDVGTAARGYAAMADEPDATALEGDLSALTVGVEDRTFADPVEDRVARAVRAAVDDLADAGAEVVEVDIPALEYTQASWWGLAPAEFAGTLLSGNAGLWRRGRVEPSLARAVRELREGAWDALGENAKDMLALGAHLLVERGGIDYVRGTNLRATLTEQYDAALSEVDVLAGPATPQPALEIGGFERGVTAPVNWSTHPTDLTGHPAISVPAGEIDGRPIGLQFVGPAGGEQAVLDAAYGHEQLVG